MLIKRTDFGSKCFAINASVSKQFYGVECYIGTSFASTNWFDDHFVSFIAISSMVSFGKGKV